MYWTYAEPSSKEILPTESLYLKVPQGMEQHYGNNVYLHLCKTLFGLKQSAFRFWMFLLEIVGRLGCARSKADPCIYFRWTESGALLLWFSWVDDCFITGPTEELLALKKNILKEVDCDDSGEIKEFVGCKIAYNTEMKSLKITQPVLMQSYEDEFDIATGHEVPKTPGVPYKALQIGAEQILQGEQNTYFRSGVGKLMHMRRWSRPD
jgi:hypothetical protein